LAGILFIISAPSGSGKSTLVSELRKQVSGVDFAVSWTTRAPRGSEADGREYHFTTREEFLRMVDAGMFLEHAEVFGNLYGTSRQSLDEALAAGHDLRNQGLEVMAVGSQAMQPDHGGVWVGCGLDFDGLQHRALAYKNRRAKIPHRVVDGRWIFMQNPRNFMQRQDRCPPC